MSLKDVNEGNTDVLWDRRSQPWWWISGQKFHQAAAFTCLTSPVTERQRETEGSVRACAYVRVCVCIKARWLLSQLMELVQDSVRNQVCVWETEGVRVRARSSGCQRSWTKTGRYFWGRNMSGESNLQRFGEKRRSVNATAAGSEFKVNFDIWSHCRCCYSFNKGSTSSKRRFNELIMRRSTWEHCKITSLMQ